MALPAELLDAAEAAITTIKRINSDVAKAQDNLLLTKISQLHYADASQAPDPNYKIGDFVMLSTKHRQHKYKKKGDERTAKFFPWWDGPYHVIHTHSESSSYMLDIPTNAYLL
jgi:hypothetical protein